MFYSSPIKWVFLEFVAPNSVSCCCGHSRLKQPPLRALQRLNSAAECSPLMSASYWVRSNLSWHMFRVNHKLNSCLWTAGSCLCFSADERVKRTEVNWSVTKVLSISPPPKHCSSFPPSESLLHPLGTGNLDISLKHLCGKYLLVPSAELKQFQFLSSLPFCLFFFLPWNKGFLLYKPASEHA